LAKTTFYDNLHTLIQFYLLLEFVKTKENKNKTYFNVTNKFCFYLINKQIGFSNGLVKWIDGYGS